MANGADVSGPVPSESLSRRSACGFVLPCRRYGQQQLGEVIHVLYEPDGGASGHYQCLIRSDSASSGQKKRPESPVGTDKESAKKWVVDDLTGEFTYDHVMLSTGRVGHLVLEPNERSIGSLCAVLKLQSTVTGT